MEQKSSAFYQRRYRDRLRQMGLVKREVWVHPDNSKLLSLLEKDLRSPVSDSWKEGVQRMVQKHETWSIGELFIALKEDDAFSGEQVTIEMIEGLSPALLITMHEYGDLPLYLTIAGEQMLVESVLWSASDVVDTAGLNDAILRTHKYFPLSTISLDAMDDGQDYYRMFGALSAASILQNIVLEIETLAGNVIQAAQAYADYLSDAAEA